MKRLIIVIILILLCLPGRVLSVNKPYPTPDSTFAHDPRVKKLWVDSVYASLDSCKQIAQLFIIRAWSDRDQRYFDSLTNILVTFNPGGVCYFKGTPCVQANLTNMWMDSMQTPPLIATDAEWGIGMRLDSAFIFPFQMTLGATTNDSLVYEVAKTIGRDCKRMGVHLNFAPVVDINNNPANPVINMRSFGEDPLRVSELGALYTKGLQSEGVMAFAKHFPGHGDTDTDSHLSLPLILHSAGRLDSVELFPFRKQIYEGVGGIMIAHLFIPALDTTPGIASTLSRPVITGLLKETLGFKGFVVTDALDMQGVTKYVKPGEIELKALMAGNDILLLPQNLGVAIKTIKAAADSLIIPWTLIEERCKRILELKYDEGLSRKRKVEILNITKDLNPRSSEILRREVYKEALTLLKNDNQVPIRFLDRKRIASVAITDSTETVFTRAIQNYAPVKAFTAGKNASKNFLDSLLLRLKDYDLVILSLHRMNLYPQNNFGLTRNMMEFIDSLTLRHKTILVLFGNPYMFDILPGTGRCSAVMTSYQDQPVAEELMGQALFGGISFTGRLPVTVNGFPAGTGLNTDIIRLATAPPEEKEISPEQLLSIDSIALTGIEAHAYPGCQVLFALDGKVIYQKSFGVKSVGDSLKVTNDDVYDLASVTKVLATTLAIMKLSDDGKIDPDKRLSHYLTELKRTDKDDLTIREVMAHQAGFQPWIPFYLKTLRNGVPDPDIYSDSASVEFPIRVAEKLYLKQGYPDSLIDAIIKSPVGARGHYLYSDLGFYLLARLVERVTHKPFDIYLDETFYRPLGLSTLGFKPLSRIAPGRIIPTENDTVFRRQLLRGDVHDQGAALTGGVSGHAGLFSDGFDCAVILQMLLNYGEYGGKQYLMPSTIREFTQVQFPENGNRRGMGFDKPPAHGSIDGPACPSASADSYGHSGFTGTYVWADPDYKLAYVFLSNRINPSSSNNKLSELNIRTRIHEAMYQILKKQQEN